MKTLGEYLVENGWITGEQLQKALTKQKQVGGRLGTCLIETGMLDEALLLRALSEQSGAPTASAADLQDLPAETVAQLPAKVAARHLAIPFRLFGNKVDVAVTDVGDLTRLDELSFVLGKRVRLHVASEAAIRQALERYYQVPCPQRFRLLRNRAPQHAEPAPVGQRQPPVAKTARAPEAVRPEPAAPPPAERPTRKSSIPLTAEEENALWGTSVSRPAVEEIAETGGESADFGRRLAEARRPQDVGGALRRALADHFLRVLVFRVVRQRATGWLHGGPEIDASLFTRYNVDLRRPSVFREIQASRRFFLGRLDGNPLHAELAKILGGDTAVECLVFPILVRERMAGAVYCDRGSLGVTGVDIATVRDLCVRAGLALERLILDRKLRG